jgi:predicted enzyme related to lactoylglutathione lyase
MGPDAEAQKKFYSAIFDWEFETIEGFDSYYTTTDDEMGVTGAVGKGGDEMPTYQCIYVGVDDINAKLSQVEAAGGKTVMPRTEIPSVVTFAMFNDPAGNLVGLVEDDE